MTNKKFFDNFRNWKRKFSSTKPIKIINDNTNSDTDKLGAIGDIDFAVKKDKIDDDILIIAGDNLFNFDLIKLNDFFKENNKSVIALYDIEEKNIASGKYGVVELDDKNKIIGFEEKPKDPKTSFVSTACYILSKSDLQLLGKCIAEHQKPDNLGDFIKWLSIRKPIYGFVFNEKWFDIGSKEQLKEADEFFSQEK